MAIVSHRAAIVGLIVLGCTTPIASEPIAIGEPTTGSFHLRAEPQTAGQPLTIRVDDGSPSRWSEEVPAGAPVWVFMTTFPAQDLGIWVNGLTCEERFPVKAGFETDLLLTMTEDGCRIRVIGRHPEGAVEHRYVPASTAPSLAPDVAVPESTT